VGGRMNGGMDEWMNQMKERKEETWGRMLRGKRREEGKRLKNRMRRGITGMRGWKKLLLGVGVRMNG
jgi:hypothetical protein